MAAERRSSMTIRYGHWLPGAVESSIHHVYLPHLWKHDTKSLVCPALESPSVRRWWKKIKDGWLNYLEKRKEAGEKGRMMSVWSRATPRRGMYLDTFDEARFRYISVSLSIWSDLVSTLLVRVSVFLPDLDNSSLSVSSYSSFGVTLLTSMPVIFDVTREDSPQQNFFIIQQANKGFSLFIVWLS